MVRKSQSSSLEKRRSRSPPESRPAPVLLDQIGARAPPASRRAPGESASGATPTGSACGGPRAGASAARARRRRSRPRSAADRRGRPGAAAPRGVDVQARDPVRASRRPSASRSIAPQSPPATTNALARGRRSSRARSRAATPATLSGSPGHPTRRTRAATERSPSCPAAATRPRRGARTRSARSASRAAARTGIAVPVDRARRAGSGSRPSGALPSAFEALQPRAVVASRPVLAELAHVDEVGRRAPSRVPSAAAASGCGRAARAGRRPPPSPDLDLVGLRTRSPRRLAALEQVADQVEGDHHRALADVGAAAGQHESRGERLARRRSWRRSRRSRPASPRCRRRGRRCR